jgi:hypothetical protein
MMKSPGEVLPGFFVFRADDVIPHDSKEVNEGNRLSIFGCFLLALRG